MPIYKRLRCNFFTEIKTNYNIHLQTNKHKRL